VDDGPQSGLGRFLALVKRELGASDVRLLPPSEPVEAGNILTATLAAGQIVAVFDETPPDRDALERRLAMLVGTFNQSLEGGREHTPRPPPTRSLGDELAALATRAQAVDAVVIDAHSPVVWGSAVRGAVANASAASDSSGVALAYIEPASIGGGRAAQDGSLDLGEDSPPPPDAAAIDEAERVSDRAELSPRAVKLVRALPAIGGLRKGGKLHAVLRDEGIGYVATSFASIYVLVLVYAAPFDELRAERSLLEALPRIERLVLALPPRDPPPAPLAGVVSLRRARRR
jgi:hypothetical protein